MHRFDDLPITDAREVEAFLDRVPVAVDRERFRRFALGFPHRYLSATSPVEVLKHFALVESLGERSAVSALSRDGEAWRLVVVTRDRSFLFGRIAGSLFLFGANVLAAEAIANTLGIVLDVFRVAAPDGALAVTQQRRRLQAFLERVIDGREDLDAALAERAGAAPATQLSPSWNEDASPRASVLRLRGPDSPGLLYRVARILWEAGCNIELAHVNTAGGEVNDELHLTVGGERLPEELERRLAAALIGLGDPG